GVTLTSDNWNSEHTNDEYFCIIAYWVDKGWKLQKRIKRFRALSPPYDVRCCAHILNLIVKANLELTDDVVDVLDYWGQQDKDYQIFSLFNEEWGNVVILCKIWKTILSNLKLLFEEYVNNSKSMSSSLAGSSNVSDNDHVDSSLHQLNVNRVDLERDYDESDDYRRYLSKSSTKSERSQLDIYLEKPELELNSQIDVLDY
ncbi:hypothetical protein Godav_011639, partial [Gossypium davidsonii]|nr:hypothetical protein [Gossypium davidsonii]